MAQRRGRSPEGAQSQCHLGLGHPWWKESEINDSGSESCAFHPLPLTLGLLT